MGTVSTNPALYGNGNLNKPSTGQVHEGGVGDLIDKAKEPLNQAKQVLTQDLGKMADTVKKNWLPFTLSGAGLIALAGGLTGLLIYRARQRNRFLGWLQDWF